MFELLDLILASPIGALLLTGLQDSIYALILASDCDQCDFKDLGKLLFGGLAVAVLAGIGISIWLRRAKDKNTASSGFVSIRHSDHRE